MGILSIFGYDRKTQDARVDAAKLARDQAIWDSYKIEDAANLLRSQTGILEGQAGQLFAAANQARAIGVQNAARIQAEGKEAQRRRGLEQTAVRSMTKAVAAASGIRINTGGSSDIYRAEMSKQHGLELSWMQRAADSQSTIARSEAEYSAMQAEAAGTGVLAGIPGILASAQQYDAAASALRTGGEVAVAEARASRAAARSGAYLAVVGTALSIASGGAALGLWGPGAAAWSVGTKAVMGGLILAGGAATVYGASKGGDSGPSVALDYQAGSAPTVQGVNTSANYQAPDVVAKNYVSPPLLPSAVKATATTKKQYLAQEQVAGKKTNLFGSSTNPLAIA